MRDSSEYVDAVKLQRSRSDQREVTPGAAVGRIIWNLWPASQTYHSPLNPTFLGQLPTPADFNFRERWIVRDGSVLLSRFFRRQPRPHRIRSRLYVEHSLAKLVPAAWHNQVGTYQVISTVPEARPNTFLFSGPGWRSDHSVHELMTRLKALDQAYVVKAKKIVFLPVKMLQDSSYQTFPVEYISALQSWTQGFEIMNWASFGFQPSFKGHHLVHLSSKRYCADSFIVHLVLSRGGQLANSVTRGDGGKFVALSPHHGYSISETIEATV
jgi:hypothetical protein